MKTAFLTHPLFLEHQTGAHHPETAARLLAIEEEVRHSGLWEGLEHLAFEAATEADLARCHLRSHIARVKQLAQNGGGSLDGDTLVSPQSFNVASLASGAAIRAVEAVWNGEADNAFVASRPPGHHAESGRDSHSLWGFCLFNHVAVAARYAQAVLGAKKVAILDFDVHHGNGTQEIFYNDASVFFASIHETPLFPGSGAASERGAGEGVGTTLNLPLPALAGGALYRLAWAQVGMAIEKFSPDLIILSAGFDAHENDPLAHMKLGVEDFTVMVSDAKNWAQQLCGGKLVAVLEGGYNLTALAHSVAATLRVLKRD